ncbi:hypothetical protein PENTCL1PPCAC_8025, partial [Pristionchus entomophagus]
MQIPISRVVCDFIILVACGLPVLIFHLWVEPFKRGFFCDDESIRYPFHDSTVTHEVLAAVGLILPICFILMTESFRSFVWNEQHTGQSKLKTYHLRDLHVHPLVVRLYTFIGYFLVGVCFNQVLVDIAKYSIGRQRPHFMDVCRPSKGYTECTVDLFITDFECTGEDANRIRESMLSFYSGHSAFAFYVASFTALYLQGRLIRPLLSRLLLPTIQIALVAGASFVAYSRVSDYKHHWSDVLVGVVMGSAVGIFVAVVVAEVFKHRHSHMCEEVTRELGLI